MSLENLIAVGKNKDGDFDFSVSALVEKLSYDEMNEFGAMCMVAIGIAESMYLRNQFGGKELTINL